MSLLRLCPSRSLGSQSAFTVTATPFSACTSKQLGWKRRRGHRLISFCSLYRSSPAALLGFPMCCSCAQLLAAGWLVCKCTENFSYTFPSLCHPCWLYCTMLSLKIPSVWNTCLAARMVALPPCSAVRLLSFSSSKESETFTEPAPGYREGQWLATLQVSKKLVH